MQLGDAATGSEEGSRGRDLAVVTARLQVRKSGQDPGRRSRFLPTPLSSVKCASNCRGDDQALEFKVVGAPLIQLIRARDGRRERADFCIRPLLADLRGRRYGTNCGCERNRTDRSNGNDGDGNRRQVARQEQSPPRPLLRPRPRRPAHPRQLRPRRPP